MSFYFYGNKGKNGLVWEVLYTDHWQINSTMNPPSHNASDFNHMHTQLCTGIRRKIGDYPLKIHLGKQFVCLQLTRGRGPMLLTSCCCIVQNVHAYYFQVKIPGFQVHYWKEGVCIQTQQSLWLLRHALCSPASSVLNNSKYRVSGAKKRT